MKRLTCAAVLLVTATGLVSARTAQGTKRSYLVTVIAESGVPVRSLTAADFVVREDSDVRKVLSAELSTFPLAVSLLIDMTQPALEANMLTRDLRTAVTSFVGAVRASETNSKIALVEVSAGTATTAGFDAPASALDAAAQRLFPAHPADAILLEAIGQAAKSLQPMPTPRRAIVTLDFNSSESQTEDTMKRMTDSLHESGATVWSVSVRLPRASGSRRDAALNLITRVSGGLRLVAGASSGLEAQLTKIAHSLASQYILTVARPDDAPVKALRIETTQGLKVHVSPMSR